MEKDQDGTAPDTAAHTPGQDPTTTAVEQYLRLAEGSRHLSSGESERNENNAALFKDVSVWGVDTGTTYQETIFSYLFTLASFFYSLLSQKKDAKKVILHGVDGIVREGEMLLVLGRPGSGCTTLLKTLAGITESFHGWSGVVKYLGISISDIKKSYRGDVVYNAEGDVHFPYLAVQSTLGFAVETKTPGRGLKRGQRNEKIKSLSDALLTVFGMEPTRNTLVGNEFVQGVSGGERKRVSLAEVMSTNAKVSLWDNSTQGLDASTSIRFGKSLQVYTKSGNNIVVAALYQASDNLVNLFDKVTILSEGRQIFFGTIQDGQEYFTSLGFVWPERQNLSEFFIAVIDRNLRVTKDGWEDRVPRSIEDFAKCWKQSTYYQKLQEELAQHMNTSLQGNGDKRSKPHVLPHAKSSYALSWPAQIAITLRRAVLRARGDRAFLAASIVMPVFVALVFGSAFYNTPNNTQGFFSRQGVVFFGILFNNIQTLGEISTQYAQRLIVQKQAGFAMYHPGIDALSSLASTWPVKLVSVTLFSTELYFLADLKREAGAYFTFLLFIYTTVLIMGSMFRFIAAINKHEATAMSIAGVLILPMVIYTGYVIPPTSMHPWFKWISYINPLSYSFESLMANEFHNREVPCARLIPSGPGYQSILPQNQVCPVTGSTPGTNLVSGDRYIELSFNYHYSHLWRNYGILIGYFIFFFVLYGLAVEFVPQVVKGKGDILIFLRHGRGNKRSEKPEQDPDTNDAATPVSPNETGPDKRSGFGKLKRSQDSFTWDKIEYQIPVKGGTKTLLTGIHGFVKPGSMTALMGESGAGKTTLLNVLAQRTHTGIVRGDILINGAALGDDFPRRTGYVECQDVHLSQFTVRETLGFSAQLRQSQHISAAEKNEYVEEIIDVLDMKDYADAVIGVPGSGLSLEQRKRMTVGVELVAKPSLLFLDEPTSGLDSQSSWSIISCLRKLADSGQAILCTIHQPSSFLFEQFDRILLLEKGGRCVYFGNIGPNSSDLIRYFESNGAAKCSPKQNPAEYGLKVTEAQSTKANWADVWRKSGEARAVDHEIAVLSHQSISKETNPSHRGTQDKSTDPASLLRQYQLVQSRAFRWYFRSPVYIRGKVIINVAAGLFLGFTFYKQHNSAQGLQNKMFASFASLILSAPLMNGLQPRFIEMRAIYEAREEPSKMFHWSIFIITIVLTEIITNIMSGTLFFLPWYFAVGFWQSMTNRAARGAYQWLIFVMFEAWVSSFGQLLAAMAPNVQVAALLIPMTFVFVALFCGVLQPLSQLPKFWHFVHYASPFTWLVEGLFSNVIHNTTVTCTPLEINIFQPPPGKTCGQFAGPFLSLGIGALYNPNATSDCEYCRFSTGDQYLKMLGFSWSHRWRNFGFMWVYVLFNVGMMCFVTWLPRMLRRRAVERGRNAAVRIE